MAYTTILFDVDGTVCDPGKSMLASAKYALGKLGVHESNEENLRRLIGPPLEHAFKEYYGFDDAQTDQAVAHFRDMLVREGIQLYEAYPHIPELLRELKQAGKRLAVVTSKIDHIAQEALRKTGLIDTFEYLSAQQPGVVVKKEAILAAALTRLGVTDLSTVVMVGDRRHDIEAANAQGVDSIGVLWGYGDRAELEREGATHIAATASELRQLLL